MLLFKAGNCQVHPRAKKPNAHRSTRSLFIALTNKEYCQIPQMECNSIAGERQAFSQPSLAFSITNFFHTLTIYTFQQESIVRVGHLAKINDTNQQFGRSFKTRISRSAVQRNDQLATVSSTQKTNFVIGLLIVQQLTCDFRKLWRRRKDIQ